MKLVLLRANHSNVLYFLNSKSVKKLDREKYMLNKSSDELYQIKSIYINGGEELRILRRIMISKRKYYLFATGRAESRDIRVDGPAATLDANNSRDEQIATGRLTYRD